MTETLNRRGRPREERGQGHTRTHPGFFYKKLGKMLSQLEKLIGWLPGNHENTQTIIRVNEIRQTIRLKNVERSVALSRLIAEVHKMLSQAKAACKERGRQLSKARRGSRPRRDRPGPDKKAQERQLALDADQLHEDRVSEYSREEPVGTSPSQQVDRDDKPIDPEFAELLDRIEASEARQAG